MSKRPAQDISPGKPKTENPMGTASLQPVVANVLAEQQQTHETRKHVLDGLESALGRPVVTLFTSFKLPAMLDDGDADILEGVLQKVDLSKGLALVLSSPGGDGLAAERIINVCRQYSGTGEYWAVVPSKAKSAATIVCFGASKIIMGGTSELGPIDPQIIIPDTGLKQFSVYNIVKSYDNLFRRAVRQKSGNLQPYIQQLEHYDEREITELRAAMELAADIAVKSLRSGMLDGKTAKEIKDSLKGFLTPEQTKIHARPIYRDQATKAGLNIEVVNIRSEVWNLMYELYIRTDNFVSSRALKCVETRNHSFFVPLPDTTR
ncbi:MAG: hypothetical protein AB1473_20965 [Thermodesulfobacteriota bacterium]